MAGRKHLKRIVARRGVDLRPDNAEHVGLERALNDSGRGGRKAAIEENLRITIGRGHIERRFDAIGGVRRWNTARISYLGRTSQRDDIIAWRRRREILELIGPHENRSVAILRNIDFHDRNGSALPRQDSCNEIMGDRRPRLAIK